MKLAHGFQVLGPQEVSGQSSGGQDSAIGKWGRIIESIPANVHDLFVKDPIVDRSNPPCRLRLRSVRSRFDIRESIATPRKLTHEDTQDPGCGQNAQRGSTRSTWILAFDRADKEDRQNDACILKRKALCWHVFPQKQN